ncbi:cobalt-zinc-cadmium efflux system membrane fusion protein [Extensimonas vulgaris]|uniref:Cobalt-zinc-cadmium efflux system membrane fusion protein n=2 Tax=Extensimonas vulgaris TaxID=1031594 RepID=A0A369ANB1_9BURK|nr:cobalt-zinc-cadmium efflux system membrane fusion protein [Extensimonas vulgaris]TWI39307.1 cobalt-zinc-cadmium efflux system membrane fusion protein [Extensimonas vulgaris]
MLMNFSFHKALRARLRRGVPLGLLALAAAALLGGCGRAASSEAASAAPEAAPPIVQNGQLHFPPGHPQLALLGVATAQPSQNIALDLPARLVWNEERTERIYPAFAGRVAAMRADLGQTVKAGTVLALLASPDFGQAQADAAKARAQESVALKALQRQRELFAAGIVARKDLEQAQADAVSAQAESARAVARTRLYGGDARVDQQLAIKSDIAGVVVERNLNPGQELRPDQSGPGTPALFVVTDPSVLWLQIDAHEADLAALQPGSRFSLTVNAYPGERFTGQVMALADAIDPTTRTIKVRGVVPNPDRRLKAEMLATVHLTQKSPGGVVVPAQAVTLRGNAHVVFVQREPGVFEPRTVTVGNEGQSQVVITAGLRAGEKVVSQNVLQLAQQYAMGIEDAGVKKEAQ